MGRGRPRKDSAAKDTVVAKKKESNADNNDVSDDDNLEQEDGDCDDLNQTNGDEMVEDVTASALPVSSKSIQKIILTHKGIVDIGWENIEQVTINHPKTEQSSVFLIDTRIPATDKELSSNAPFIFEVMTMEQDTRSWFIGDNIIPDGNIYVCTPMDPLYFVLPALSKTTHAMPLKDHLRETIGDSKIVNAISARLSASGQLENIAKKIVCDDIIAFKFMEDKTVEWLTTKAKKTANFLKGRNITGSEASISSNFTKSSTDETKQEEYMRYACEIVGEYLSDDLKKKLFENLGVPLVQEKVIKRKSDLEFSDSPNAKKLKVTDSSENVQPTEDYGTSSPSTLNNVNSKVTAKDKEFQKAAKGSQSLFKFFSAKTK